MIAAIIQARMGSIRLAGKIFFELAGKPLIWHVVDRLKPSKKLKQIVIATTTSSGDDRIENWCVDNNVHCFRGSEDDVLDRYYHAAKSFNIQTVVRITADDPFKDYEIIDQMLEVFALNEFDCLTNNNPPTFPEGIDVEVFSFTALEKAWKESRDQFEREHVTQYFYRRPELFKLGNHRHSKNLSNLRWTIDYRSDYEMAKAVYEHFEGLKQSFLMNDILEFLKANPEISEINNKEQRSTQYAQ